MHTKGYLLWECLLSLWMATALTQSMYLLLKDYHRFSSSWAAHQQYFHDIENLHQHWKWLIHQSRLMPHQITTDYWKLQEGSLQWNEKNIIFCTHQRCHPFPTTQAKLLQTPCDQEHWQAIYDAPYCGLQLQFQSHQHPWRFYAHLHP